MIDRIMAFIIEDENGDGGGDFIPNLLRRFPRRKELVVMYHPSTHVWFRDGFVDELEQSTLGPKNVSCFERGNTESSRKGSNDHDSEGRSVENSLAYNKAVRDRMSEESL
jgi:hypothetical protein